MLQVSARRWVGQCGDFCQATPASRARSAATQLCTGSSRSPRAPGWQSGSLLWAAVSHHHPCATSVAADLRARKGPQGRTQRLDRSQTPNAAVVLLDQATTAAFGESAAHPGDQPTVARQPTPMHLWRKPLLISKRTKSLDINSTFTSVCGGSGVGAARDSSVPPNLEVG